MTIFIIGFMGAGKSHWGKSIADSLHIDFIDLDEHIEHQENMTIIDIFNTLGETPFRTLEEKHLKQIGLNKDTIVAVGGGTPCFHNNMQWMNKHGISIYLRRTINYLEETLSKDFSNRPLLNNIDKDSLHSKIKNLIELREETYTKAHYIIDDINPTKKIIKIYDNLRK